MQTSVLYGINKRILTANEGLSINEVTDLYQDKTMQYMWICTQNGLNRYDGHQIKKYYLQRKQPKASNFINSITEDNDNNLWIATKKGIACFNYLNDKWDPLPSKFSFGNYTKILQYSDTLLIGLKDAQTIFTINTKDKIRLKEISLPDLSLINDIAKIDNQVFISSSEGLFSFNIFNEQLKRIAPEKIKSCSKISYLHEDHSLWINSMDSWLRIPINNGKLKIETASSANDYFGLNEEIRNIECRNQKYWILAINGIKTIDKKAINKQKKSFQTLFSNYSFKKIIFDNKLNLWGGTWQSGVVMFPYNQSPFITHFKSELKQGGLPSRLIRGFCEIDSIQIAVATETLGLVIFNRKTNKFSPAYSANITTNQSKFSINGDIMHVIKKDWKGRIWAGYHQDGFNVIYGNDKTTINRLIREFNKNDDYQICDDFLFDAEHSKAYILSRHQIIEYDDNAKSIRKVDTKSFYISCFIEDGDHSIWVAGRNGIRTYKAGFSYENQQLNEKLEQFGLLNADVNSLYLDSDNILWIGTYGDGIFYYDRTTEKFHEVKPPLHIDFRIVYSIIEDDNRTIWMGTNNGLFSYNKNSKKFNRYSVEDGVQNNQFNYNSVYKAADGTLFFGGISGFTYFHPNDVKTSPKLPKPIISDFKIGDNKLDLFVNKQLRKLIEIPFSNNSFEFSFFTQDFSYPENYIYSFRLIGLSTKEQLCPPNTPKALFTNVPAGTYQLEVRATKPNSEWSEVTLSPSIIVLPPWYKSPIAFSIYASSLILIFSWSIYYTKQRAKFKNSLEISRLEKEKSEQVNAAKLRFFTDIAHEIRTPLTLIAGPLNDLMSTRKFDNPMQKSLGLMQKSVHKLMSLMDELLLFRKAENGSFPLKLIKNNVTLLINNVCSLFEHEMAIKKIDFQYPKFSDSFEFVFDFAKMEKVINNILNNALKFTDENGAISIEAITSKNGFTINIADTGKGMSEQELENIFNRFYQAEGSSENGFGIGLTLAKRIIEAHGGTISVKSKMNHGTTFTIFIPPLKANQEEKASNQPKQANLKEIKDNSFAKRTIIGNILIVEDNEDIRNYIAEIFEGEFNVATKQNGIEGYNYTTENLPDLVITDFQMPKMDGITMCKKIKETMLTSHIPVVLLSAFNEVEDQLNGLSVGADDYIGKPFEKKILFNKITNIINSRKQLIRSFQKEGKIDITKFERADQRFINKINRLILNEMSNAKMDVPYLCKKLEVGKTSLNEKLKSMLCISPAEYIKKIKLKEAYRLLTEEGYSIADASYATGFSPTYFSTCFKKEFGVSPGKIV